MIGGLKKEGLYLFAGASVFAILASAAPVAKAQYITKAEFEEYKKSQPKVQWKGAPMISSQDGKFSFKVRGRLQVDYNSINQDERITGDPDINDWEARRARLGVEGTIWYDWKYKFEVDFAGNETEIKDAYIAYAGFSDWNNLQVLFGQFKVANSLEGMTSTRYITFMERAFFIEALGSDSRALGVGIHAGSNDDFGWSFQSSFNGPNIGDDGVWDDGPSIWAARATIAPINTDDAIVQLGASYRSRNNGTEDGVSALYNYEARPGLHLADKFVETEPLGESDQSWGLEGAAVYRRFSVQGEYAELKTDVPHYYKSMSTRSLNPDYSGWYVFGSVFLTDDMRNYETKKGKFGRVKPNNPFDIKNGGWGAWEVAGRWQSVDVGAEAAALLAAGHDCDKCGDEEGWTLALNWYPTAYTRLMFNVIGTDIGGAFNDNDGAGIDGFGLRGQIDW